MTEPKDWDVHEIVENVAALRKAWESPDDGEEANRQVGQAAERLLTRFLLDHHRIAVALEKIAEKAPVEFHPSILRPRREEPETVKVGEGGAIAPPTHAFDEPGADVPRYQK